MFYGKSPRLPAVKKKCPDLSTKVATSKQLCNEGTKREEWKFLNSLKGRLKYILFTVVSVFALSVAFPPFFLVFFGGFVSLPLFIFVVVVFFEAS